MSLYSHDCDVERELDRSVFKGFQGSTENSVTLVFEKNGKAFELNFTAWHDTQVGTNHLDMSLAERR